MVADTEVNAKVEQQRNDSRNPENDQVNRTAVYAPEMTVPIATRKDRYRSFRDIFLIKMLLLVPTVLQVLPLVLVPDARNFLMANTSVIYFALALYASSTLIFAFLPNLHGKNPYSMLFAFIMVEALSAIVAFISIYYYTNVVMISFGIASVSSIVLAVLGIYCTVNLDKIGIMVFSIGVVILCAGIIIYTVELFVTCYKLSTIYSIVALIVMYIYFFYAIQGVNDEQKKVDAGDRFLTAMSLYTNFITIFLLCEYILEAAFL